MGKRYLERIEYQLNSVSSLKGRGRLLARKASYLARIGRFEEASEIIDELRRPHDVYEDAELSILLTFVDGLIAFYRDLIDVAQDRFSRSCVLGKAAGIREVSALSSAWLAHLAFGRFDFECLVTELRYAFSNVRLENHDCLARLCLVLAQTAHLAAGQEHARAWYLRARMHALEIADESTISSIMYNMTVMRIVNYRQSLLWKGESDDSARLAVSNAESTDNFDKLVGVVSLEDFTPLLRAQTYSLAERYQEAEEIYAETLILVPSKAQSRSRCWLLADRAFCLVRLGLRDAARIIAEEAIGNISADVQIDDLAATHGRLSAVYAELGDGVRAEGHFQESSQMWARFSRLQGQVREMISDFDHCYESLETEG